MIFFCLKIVFWWECLICFCFVWISVKFALLYLYAGHISLLSFIFFILKSIEVKISLLRWFFFMLPRVQELQVNSWSYFYHNLFWLHQICTLPLYLWFNMRTYLAQNCSSIFFFGGFFYVGGYVCIFCSSIEIDFVFAFAGIAEYDIIHNKTQHAVISVVQAEAISNQ